MTDWQLKSKHSLIMRDCIKMTIDGLHFLHLRRDPFVEDWSVSNDIIQHEVKVEVVRQGDRHGCAIAEPH